jgi:hypothetical protein
MLQTWLWRAVLWFPVVAVGSLCVILGWRRLWKELPLFLLYLVSAELVTISRYLSLRWGRAPYFYTYWISDLAISVVALLPLYEVFMRRLFRGFHQTRFYRNIFPLVATAILVLTVVTALQAPDKGAAFHMASRAFDFMRTGVLIFFLGLMLFMGREWTRYDLGVALGFGVQAAAALANSAVRTRMHYQTTIWDILELVAYDVTCFIWLITFWKPEKRTEFLSPEQLDPEMLHQARSWETQLKAWLTPGKSKR